MVWEAENANHLQIVYMNQPSCRRHGNLHQHWMEIGEIRIGAEGKRHRIGPCFERGGCGRDGPKPALWNFPSQINRQGSFVNRATAISELLPLGARSGTNRTLFGSLSQSALWLEA